MMGRGSGRTETLVWQPCCEEVLVQRICCELKVQGFKVLLFVTYSIIQDIISSEM